MQLRWIRQKVQGQASFSLPHTIQKREVREMPATPGSILAALVENRMPVIHEQSEDRDAFKKTKYARKINPAFSISHFSFSLFAFLQGLKFNLSFSKLELTPSLPLAFSPEGALSVYRYAQLIRKPVPCHQGLLSPRKCVGADAFYPSPPQLQPC